MGGWQVGGGGGGREGAVSEHMCGGSLGACVLSFLPSTCPPLALVLAFFPAARGRTILYITERAVFRLVEGPGANRLLYSGGGGVGAFVSCLYIFHV